MKNTIYKKIIKTITRNTNVLSLNEALQTYPIKRLSKFFDELSDTYNIEIEYDENKAILKKYFIVTEDKYDDLQLFIYHKDYSEISKDVLEKIISEFNRIGYFYSFTDYKYIEDIENIETIRTKTYNFSPYTQNEIIKKQDLFDDYVYHMCPSYVLNKILKKGLMPKSKNPEFSYSERVYVYCSHRPYNELQYLKTYRSKHNTSKLNNGEYYLLTIDVNKIPNNIQFFIDFDSKFAVYTNDCIPANAIVKYEKMI